MLATLTVMACGLLTGFFFAVPATGPVGALLWSRALSGRSSALVALGLGSSIAETAYATVASYSVGHATAVLAPYLAWAEGLGAVVLTTLGLAFLLKKAAPSVATSAATEPVAPAGTRRSFWLGFTLTGINPALIFSWGAAIAALHSLGVSDTFGPRALVFGAGAFVGLNGWYLTLDALSKKHQHRLNQKTVTMILRVMGAMLLALGLVAGARLLLR